MKNSKLTRNIIVVLLFVLSGLFFYNLGVKNKDKDESVDEYNITVQSSSGGSLTSNVPEAKAGDEIVLTLNIDENYKFKEWEIIAGNIEIKDNKFNMPAADVVIKAIFEEDIKIVVVNDNELLKNVLKKFSGRLGYEYCSLDLSTINELYSDSFDVNTISNDLLFLIAINNEEVEAEVGTFFSKNYLNNKVKNLLNTNKEIDFNSIASHINNFNYENYSNEEIKVSMNIFGCLDNLDDLIKVIISGEEDNNHLYIYERIAFGRNSQYGEMSYYKDPGLNTFVESFEYDIELPSSQVTINDYNLYKYTFLKEGSTYKLLRIEKYIN